MKLKAFMLLLSFSTVAHSYEPERAIVNLADDLSTCAAFYLFMSRGLEKMDKDSTGLKASAAEAHKIAVSISNLKVTGARIEMSLKEMVKEMDGNWSNSSIILNKYGAQCKAMVENPDIRFQYWLDKK